jgi:hypothetical protein
MPKEYSHQLQERIKRHRTDFDPIARDYAACDIVIANIEARTPDKRVRLALELCRELSSETAHPEIATTIPWNTGIVEC